MSQNNQQAPAGKPTRAVEIAPSPSPSVRGQRVVGRTGSRGGGRGTSTTSYASIHARRGSSSTMPTPVVTPRTVPSSSRRQPRSGPPPAALLQKMCPLTGSLEVVEPVPLPPGRNSSSLVDADNDQSEFFDALNAFELSEFELVDASQSGSSVPSTSTPEHVEDGQLQQQALASSKDGDGIPKPISLTLEKTLPLTDNSEERSPPPSPSAAAAEEVQDRSSDAVSSAPTAEGGILQFDATLAGESSTMFVYKADDGTGSYFNTHSSMTCATTLAELLARDVDSNENATELAPKPSCIEMRLPNESTLAGCVGDTNLRVSPTITIVKAKTETTSLPTVVAVCPPAQAQNDDNDNVNNNAPAETKAGGGDDGNRTPLEAEESKEEAIATQTSKTKATGQGLTKGNLNKDELEDTALDFKVPCRYAMAGCKAKVARETLAADEHHKGCQFRPIPCIFGNQLCREVLPFPNFVLHLHNKHYMKPNHDCALTSHIFFTDNVFCTNEVWLPKWIRIAEFDDLNFFLMMSHTVTPPVGRNSAASEDGGVWTAWVWVLGEEKVAARYYYEVIVFKGESKTGGKFTTQSIRSPVQQIIATQSCLHFTDNVAKHISKFQDGQVLSDFFIDVSIHQKPTTEGTDPNHSSTGPYNLPTITAPPKTDNPPKSSRVRFANLANFFKF